MTDQGKKEKLEEYYAYDAKKLKKLVHKIIEPIGGLYQKDNDDFYSLAGEVLHNSLNNYDGSQPFDKYFFFQLRGKIYTYLTRLNREKRRIDRTAVSWDAPLEEDEGMTYEDVVDSGVYVEAAVMKKEKSEKIESYMQELSDIQKKILKLLTEGYKPHDIQGMLKISADKYGKYIADARSYEKVKYLLRDSGEFIKEEEETMENQATITVEKTKDTAYAISNLSKKLDKKMVRDDHVLQRPSGQWGPLAKSELISDILQGKSLSPIMISEEIKGDIRMLWLIDGVQRCTIIDSYLKDGFSVSKNVQRYMISYQTFRKDEKGNDLLNEEGFPIPENKVFDIRGKRFSKLPEELQDRFLEYQVPVMLNLNCTKEEIAYDIARFNRSRPMTKAQTGWTGMDESYAEFVDAILKMAFFKVECTHSNYSKSGNRSGAMRRMVVESIMATEFLDNFNKDFGRMCRYISENANDSSFINFQIRAERISAVADEEVADMFNIKDSFLWFALFGRFDKLGLPDEQFIDFMKAFKAELHEEKIDGQSYDEYVADLKGTKDKQVVKKKIERLDMMMRQYLHIENEMSVSVSPEEDQYEEEFAESDLMESLNITKDQAKEVAAETIQVLEAQADPGEDVKENALLYSDSLNEWMLNIPGSSEKELFVPANIPQLIGLVDYAYRKDYSDNDSMKWLQNFACNEYKGQAGLLGVMKQSLDQAISA